MTDLFKRNLIAVQLSGKVTYKTTIRELELKLHEELWEVCSARKMDEKAHELGDLMMVCSTFLQLYGYDPIKILEEVTAKNESRVENKPKI